MSSTAYAFDIYRYINQFWHTQLWDYIATFTFLPKCYLFGSVGIYQYFVSHTSHCTYCIWSHYYSLLCRYRSWSRVFSEHGCHQPVLREETRLSQRDRSIRQWNRIRGDSTTNVVRSRHIRSGRHTAHSGWNCTEYWRLRNAVSSGKVLRETILSKDGERAQFEKIRGWRDE